MKRSIRGTSREIEQAAQRLRREMTPAERVLWEAIRSKRLAGLRFRHQHPVGGFILDFFCPARKLVVEVDGSIHDEQAEYDSERTKHLNLWGYRVIRFRNEEVFENLPSVLAQITRAADRM